MFPHHPPEIVRCCRRWALRCNVRVRISAVVAFDPIRVDVSGLSVPALLRECHGSALVWQDVLVAVSILDASRLVLFPAHVAFQLFITAALERGGMHRWPVLDDRGHTLLRCRLRSTDRGFVPVLQRLRVDEIVDGFKDI